MPVPRTLVADQRSRILTLDVDSGEIRLIHESDAVLYEAPNWSLDGSALYVNGDGHLFRLEVDGGEGPQRDRVTSLFRRRIVDQGIPGFHPGQWCALTVIDLRDTKIHPASYVRRGYDAQPATHSRDSRNATAPSALDEAAELIARFRINPHNPDKGPRVRTVTVSSLPLGIGETS